MSVKPYLLAVEDDPISQFAIMEMLKHYFDITCVNNGRECLDSIKNRQPDILLLDVNMPVLNGYETCKILRADKQYKDLPIIMLSAMSTEKEIAAGYEAGCDIYITKPFKQENLISSMQQLFNK